MFSLAVARTPVGLVVILSLVAEPWIVTWSLLYVGADIEARVVGKILVGSLQSSLLVDLMMLWLAPF